MKKVFSVNLWNGIKYVKPSQASEFWTKDEAANELKKFTSLKWEAKVVWTVCSKEVADDYVLVKATSTLP
jgi:hypothetical protein